MRNFKLLFFFFVFFSLSQSYASDISLVKELVEFMHKDDKENMKAYYRQIFAEITEKSALEKIHEQEKALVESFDQMGCPEEGKRVAEDLNEIMQTIIQKSQSYADALFKKNLEILNNMYIDFYAKNFTNTELNEILNFEKSPVAQKRRNLQLELTIAFSRVTNKLAEDDIKKYIDDLKASIENGEIKQMITNIVKKSSSCKTKK